MRFQVLIYIAFVAGIVFLVASFATKSHKLVKLKDPRFAHCEDIGDIGTLGYKIIGNRVEGCKCLIYSASLTPQWVCNEAKEIIK